MSVSVVPPYMFRSIPLTIFRGCSCCNATLRLVAFVTTLSGLAAVFSICVGVMCTSLLPVLLCTTYTVCRGRRFRTSPPPDRHIKPSYHIHPLPRLHTPRCEPYNRVHWPAHWRLHKHNRKYMASCEGLLKPLQPEGRLHLSPCPLYCVTQKRELLKCVVAAMYSWQHCGTGILYYRQLCHALIMDPRNLQQCAFAMKMFYKNNDSLEVVQKVFHLWFFFVGLP
jgi:hypothetical protein